MRIEQKFVLKKIFKKNSNLFLKRQKMKQDSPLT